MSEKQKTKHCNVEKPGENTISVDSKPANQEDANGSEDAMKVEAGMPTLVAKIFIESITDVELLKRCRLINKYWNFEVCAALRKLSVVKISQEICGLVEDFVTVQTGNPELSLPSPFKHLQVFAVGYRENFHAQIMSLGLEIKRFDVCLDGVEGLERVRRLLKAREAEITELEITGSNIAHLHAVFSEVQLSSVQNLRICGFTCGYGCASEDNCDHIELIKTVTMSLPLSSLTIDTVLPSCFSSFLTMDLTRLNKLRIFFEIGFERKLLEKLASLQLPSLQHLHIISHAGEEGDEMYFQQLSRLYKNISSTVKSLEVFSCSVLGTAVYSKLKSLSCSFITWKQLMKMSREEFPSLEEITLQDFDIIGNSLNVVPHEGVQKLYAHIAASNVLVNGNDPLIVRVVTALGRKFPNVRHLNVTQSAEWTSSTFQLIYQAYPHLQFLEIPELVPFEVWAGATKEELTAKGPLNLPRIVSIMDFKSLEFLVVGGCYISEELLQHCFALIPKLKYLKIACNQNIDVKVVADSLQHLNTLEISNAFECRDIARLLRTFMPRTVIKGKGVELHFAPT